MNNPEKARINCGAEGLDKSVIVKKWQSLGFEQSLTEDWNPTRSIPGILQLLELAP